MRIGFLICIQFLSSGDFYLTRHSNLCETHVIFHMVADDTLDNINTSSRHPVIIGLRNVLKVSATSRRSICVNMVIEFVSL